MDYEKIIKVMQQLTFTTFLILCVAVTSYAITRLYVDGRADWDKVQINSQKIDKLDDDIQRLVDRLNKLIEIELGKIGTPRSPMLPPLLAK